MRQRRRIPRPRSLRRRFFVEALESRETISDTILGPAVLASTLYLADRVAPLASPLPPRITQVDKVDVSSDTRRADVLTSLLDGLPWWNTSVVAQEIKRGQQASPITTDLFADEQEFFQTLDEELASLFALGFANPRSAAAGAVASAGGLINNAEPLPTTLSSGIAGSSDASSSPGVSSTSDGSIANGVADEEELLFQSAAVGSGKTFGAQAEPPAPPAVGPPPSRSIPPRPRTVGPIRPARLRGSLPFGSGTTGGSGTSGLSGGCYCSWTPYGEASVAGDTVTLGVAGRPETGVDQPSDVHGASMLLPPAAQYTISFNVNLSTWDSYNAFQLLDPGTGYWDSFSVSVTSEPYPYLSWTDPISHPFVWGGQRFGDEHLDTTTGTFTVTIPGDPNGSNYLNVVLDTFSQPDADVGYPSWGTISITAGVPVVQSITFLPTGQGTTGDLDLNGNPNGQVDMPAFGGGSRFFPDAATYLTRAQSRNIVRIRAVVANVGAGVPVYFRSFDVDDPSTNAIIDPNGNVGRDNRGIAAGPTPDEPPIAPFPAPPGLGYRGRLAPAGTTNFEDEGKILTVNTDAQGRAEVDLATSFNPGDNFRVLATCDQMELAPERLNDTTSVPTTGNIANFKGKATEQLAVWRRFHIEQDRMAPISRVTDSGTITAVGPRDPDNGEVVVTIGNLTLAANQFHGGSLRAANSADPNVPGRRYWIIRHTIGPNPMVTIKLPDDMPAPANGAVRLTQGDFEVGNITAAEVLPNGTVSLTTDLNIAQENEYQGGILRSALVNYHILRNENGLNSRVLILGNAAPPLGFMALYQDDLSSTGDRLGNTLAGLITAVDQPVGGQWVITTNRTILTANRFAGGILRTRAGFSYPIDSNTAGANATVTITGGPAPELDDMWLYTNLGPVQPTTLTDVTSDANLYDMVQRTTFRSQNRYADAYLEPEWNALNQFDSNNVVPTSHASPFNVDLRQLADPYRGTSPGSEARPLNYETNVFWTVYVVTAFETEFTFDLDPLDERPVFGITDGQDKQISLIFLETIRDAVALIGGVPYSEAQLRAMTTIHEIGHQFGIAEGVPEEHRNDTPNIMHENPFAVPVDQFFLHPADIVSLRRGITSPGIR